MSDYVPLEKDIGIPGWNQRVRSGPVSFSATVFSEELKYELRWYADRIQLWNFSSDEDRQFLRKWMSTFCDRVKAECPGYDAMHLAELIGRERGL